MSAGLYIHVPYCHAKCAYCDFYSTPDASTTHAYIDALIREAVMRRGEVRTELSTVYIGGGTPSSLGGGNLVKLIGRLKQVFDFSCVKEFTVEVNPEDVNSELISALTTCGVNRVSMGVQSLVDEELAVVGRRHTAAEAIEAAEKLIASFGNVSLDLIFGLPGQTLESLRFTLDGMLRLGAPHLSAYLLSYEPGTRLYAMLMAGKVTEAPDALADEMYRLVTSALASEGYDHYEISNYARAGFESRHNSAYWNGTPYLGLGPSAHSFDGVLRRFNAPGVKKYIEGIGEGHVMFEIDEETDANRFNDYLITRLRTAHGLDLTDLAGQPYGYLSPRIDRAIERLSNEGRIVMNNSKIMIPQELWLTSDAILRELII